MHHESWSTMRNSDFLFKIIYFAYQTEQATAIDLSSDDDDEPEPNIRRLTLERSDWSASQDTGRELAKRRLF